MGERYLNLSVLMRVLRVRYGFTYSVLITGLFWSKGAVFTGDFVLVEMELAASDGFEVWRKELTKGVLAFFSRPQKKTPKF